MNELSGSVVKILEDLLERACLVGASDIHLDPQEASCVIRFRIDGYLQTVLELPKSIHEEIISRIKVLAGLRTDEHQTAQEGRFRFTYLADQEVDLRVSVMPTYYGENVVLRVLVARAENDNLLSLGFSQLAQAQILQALTKPYGMILVTGPTGSGKTTTLYTLLKLLSLPTVSIVTIEDPIEYSIGGINQIQVNPRTGLTFANGLRNILRQDPNVVMVGEIRDIETAGIAVNAALTGHLVLSTLHTNDAATTLPRLLDMKVEPYLLASTVNISISQRLVRKICQHCKTSKKLSFEEQKSISNVLPSSLLSQGQVVFFGQGCDKCSFLGYSGRVCVSEILMVTDLVREVILEKKSSREIRRLAIESGMATIFEDGIMKVNQGITTIEEVLRILHE